MSTYQGSKSHEGLWRHLADVADAVLVPQDKVIGGAVTAKVVHGNDASLMIATREPGYHSKPHSHACEQLNYVLRGEIWIFVDDGGFAARAGDVFRIPEGAVHWSRVGASGCTLLEVHTPSLIGDETVAAAAHGLFAAHESGGTPRAVASQWPRFDRERTEQAVRVETEAQ